MHGCINCPKMQTNLYIVHMRVLPCALVLLPGSPGTKWLSNQYKCNRRTPEERGKAWRELITGQEENRMGRGVHLRPGGL